MEKQHYFESAVVVSSEYAPEARVLKTRFDDTNQVARLHLVRRALERNQRFLFRGLTRVEELVDVDALARNVVKREHDLEEAGFPALGNLFIIATHAANIPLTVLESQVLTRGRTELWKHVRDTSLEMRSMATGRAVGRSEFDARFFAFWAERRELRDPLHAAIARCVGVDFPTARENAAKRKLERFRKEAVVTCEALTASTAKMLGDLEAAQKEHEANLAAEKIMQPLRRRSQRAVEDHFKRIAATAQQALEQAWQGRAATQAIEKMIRERYPGETGKTRAKEYAGAYVLELVKHDVFVSCTDLIAGLPKEVSTLLPDEDSKVVLQLPTFEIPVDGQGVAAALAGAGVAALAGLSGGIALIVGGALWVLAGDAWQTRLARNIATELQKRGMLQQFSDALGRYWTERLQAFVERMEQRERAHSAELQQRGELISQARAGTQILEARRSWLEERRAFFRGVPSIPGSRPSDTSILGEAD